MVSIGRCEADCHYEDTICEVWDGNHIAVDNADFIANARQDIPFLLSIIDEQRKENEDLENRIYDLQIQIQEASS